MKVRRVIAQTLVVMSFIVSAAIGQQERSPHQDNQQTQFENCQRAMQVILKQYHNARYAVQRARNSADASHILPAVDEAQFALDAMEQPLKVCNDAVNMKSAQPSGRS